MSCKQSNPIPDAAADPYPPVHYRWSQGEKLGAATNSGARLINLFGWPAEGQSYGDSLRSNEAQVAFRRWLAGEPLRDPSTEELAAL